MKRIYDFLQGWFSGWLGIITAFLGRRVGLASAAIAAYLGVAAALWASIQVAVGMFSVVIPSGGLATWVQMGFTLFLPSNWDVCVSAMLAADAAVFFYRFQVQRIIAPTVQQ